jgi:predicted nuclease of predicted toxin-antitoxin system
LRVKLDENLGRTAFDLFCDAGHEVETVRSQGLSGAPDEDVIIACQRELRGLVTLDLDFSNPLVFEPSRFAGIAVLRLPAKPSHRDVLMACRTLIRALEQRTIAGKLWSVERGRIREYRSEPQGEPPEE